MSKDWVQHCSVILNTGQISCISKNNRIWIFFYLTATREREEVKAIECFFWKTLSACLEKGIICTIKHTLASDIQVAKVTVIDREERINHPHHFQSMVNFALFESCCGVFPSFYPGAYSPHSRLLSKPLSNQMACQPYLCPLYSLLILSHES